MLPGCGRSLGLPHVSGCTCVRVPRGPTFHLSANARIELYQCAVSFFPQASGSGLHAATARASARPCFGPANQFAYQRQGTFIVEEFIFPHPLKKFTSILNRMPMIDHYPKYFRSEFSARGGFRSSRTRAGGLLATHWLRTYRVVLVCGARSLFLRAPCSQ